MGKFQLQIFFFLVSGFSLLSAAGPTLATSPSLSIASPSPDSVIYGQIVPVKFTVGNFKLVDHRSVPRPVTGQGHILLWLDTSTHTKESAIKLSSDSYTFENLKPGTHILKAELVSSNHVSLTPPVTASLTFSTQALPAATEKSLLSFPAFQLSLFTFILLATTLYFINLHVKSFFSPVARPSAKKTKPGRKPK